MTKRIMITAGKGGTGKSMFAVNLGATLACKGKNVILLDMDMGLRTLDLYLGVQDEAIFDMNDAISGICELDRAIIYANLPWKLSLLAARQSTNNRELTEESLATLLRTLEEAYGYEYMIMDCPPGLGPVTDICAANADLAIMVLTPDYAAVRDADAVEDRLIRDGVFDRRYVINRMIPSLIERDIEMQTTEIDGRLKCGMLGMIAEDENIRASTNMGTPIVAMRGTYISDNFDNMADRLIDYSR